MSDDTSDLEPIDVAVEFPATTAASMGPGGGSWPPGWYADPWTAGQYRFWNGEQWTGETHRSGPAATYGVPGGSTSSGAGWPSSRWQQAATPVGAAAGPGSVVSGPAPSGPGRQRTTVIVVGLVVLVLLAGAIGFAIESSSKSKNSAAKVAPAPSTTAPSAGPRLPLSQVVVRPADVSAPRVVLLPSQGNRTTQPTLDLCNGTFASEKLRVERLQVAEVNPAGNALLSTEAVAYRNAAATEQAFAELRKVRARCPRTPVVSPVQEPAVTTTFQPAPDATWRKEAGVERLAYSFTSADSSGTKTASVTVYLRRGRVLLGVYFYDPGVPQAAVAGKTSIADIVGVFETRLAQLPSSVVNGSS